MLRLAPASTFAALVLVLAPAASCKKDSSSGLPPAKDWTAAPQQPPASAPGASPGGMGNPHGGMGNPHGDMGNPHGGMGSPPAGGGGGPVAQKTQPRTLEKLPGGKHALGPFSVAVPADWTEKAITSSMRAAQYQLAGAAGAEAELVVYYFGETGAGSVQANLDRWIDQFQQPDGKPSRDVAKIEKTKLAGQEATIVSVSGRYVTTSMPGGGDPIDRADQSLLAAIVPSPKGPYYFKLVGPKATVAAHTAKLRAMLTSLQVR
jgi:hypothetical protein